MAVNLDELTLPDELPVIPDGWRYELLGNLVEERGVSYGIVQPGSTTTDGVPIVRVNNIRNGRIDTTDMLKVGADIEAKFQRSRLHGGEVLLTLVGTLGEVAIVPDSLRGWNVARAVGVIPVRSDPGSLWLSICLRSAFIQHCIRTWATTTVQATFNLRDLAKLPIPIPPADTREAIAAVLGALDDKMGLLQFYGQVSRRHKHQFSTLQMTFLKVNWSKITNGGMTSLSVVIAFDPRPKIAQQLFWISD